MTEQTLITVAQLCARWGLEPQCVRRWIHAGHIRVVALGPSKNKRRLLRISMAEVLRIEAGEGPWRGPSSQ